MLSGLPAIVGRSPLIFSHRYSNLQDDQKYITGWDNTLKLKSLLRYFAHPSPNFYCPKSAKFSDRVDNRK